MTLFSIINAHKKFLFLLLFVVSISTAKSFATGNNDDKGGTSQDKCETTQDFSTLGEEDKTKCKDWCQIETNWAEKCKVLNINKQETSNQDVTAKVIDELKKLDKESLSEAIKLPLMIDNIYNIEFKFGKEQRAKLLALLKQTASSSKTTSSLQAKDLDNLYTQAANQDKATTVALDEIDSDEAKKVVKNMILAGLDYQEEKDGNLNKDVFEKFFIDFRNKWLKFEAKGSVDNPNAEFTPTNFQALADSMDHVNQGPMHQLYNVLEDSDKIFKTGTLITDNTKFKEELDKLRKKIISIIETNLIVEIANKTWAPDMDLVFNLKMIFTDSQSKIFRIVLTDLLTKKAEFDKIKDHVIIPNDFETNNDYPRRNDALEVASHGLAVMNGGITFNYDLNPDRVSLSAEADRKWKDEEKKTVGYKLYIAKLKAIETYLTNALITGIDYVTKKVEDGSYLHALTTLVRDNSVQIRGVENPNISVSFRNADVTDNKKIVKIGLVGKKIVILLHDSRDTHQNLFEFIDGKFTISIPTSIVANTFDNNSNVTPMTDAEMVTETTFTQQTIANTLDPRASNVFADAFFVLVLQGMVPAVSLNLIDGPAAARFFKFRIQGIGANSGIEARPNDQNGTGLNGLMSWHQMLENLNQFVAYFFNHWQAFSDNQVEIFKSLSKFNSTLGQLYVYNLTTIHIMNGIVANDTITPLSGIEFPYITSHVVNPGINAPDDTTYAITTFIRS